MSSFSGKVVSVTSIHDYSCTRCLYAHLTRKLMVMTPRLRIHYGTSPVPGWDIDQPMTQAFKIFKAERDVEVAFTVLQIESCESCNAAPIESGWSNCLTGLPEMRLPCECERDHGSYWEYGYREIRLWSHLMSKVQDRLRTLQTNEHWRRSKPLKVRRVQ